MILSWYEHDSAIDACDSSGRRAVSFEYTDIDQLLSKPEFDKESGVELYLITQTDDDSEYFSPVSFQGGYCSLEELLELLKERECLFFSIYKRYSNFVKDHLSDLFTNFQAHSLYNDIIVSEEFEFDSKLRWIARGMFFETLLEEFTIDERCDPSTYVENSDFIYDRTLKYLGVKAQQDAAANP